VRDERHAVKPMPQIVGIARVELSVSDLDRSVAWYCRLLGARDVFRNRNVDRAFSACAILEPASRTVLAFTQHDVREGSQFTPHRVGLDHLSFAFLIGLRSTPGKPDSTSSASSTMRSTIRVSPLP